MLVLPSFSWFVCSTQKKLDYNSDRLRDGKNAAVLISTNMYTTTIINLALIRFSFISTDVFQHAIVGQHLLQDAVDNLRLSLSKLTVLLVFLDQAVETIFDLDLCAAIN